jgi:G3E family GTPase
VYEQAAYADAFVLSKIDLAEKEDVEKIKKLLGTLRPGAPIFSGEWPV